MPHSTCEWFLSRLLTLGLSVRISPHQNCQDYPRLILNIRVRQMLMGMVWAVYVFHILSSQLHFCTLHYNSLKCSHSTSSTTCAPPSTPLYLSQTLTLIWLATWIKKTSWIRKWTSRKQIYLSAWIIGPSQVAPTMAPQPYPRLALTSCDSPHSISIINATFIHISMYTFLLIPLPTTLAAISASLIPSCLLISMSCTHRKISRI